MRFQKAEIRFREVGSSKWEYVEGNLLIHEDGQVHYELDNLKSDTEYETQVRHIDSNNPNLKSGWSKKLVTKTLKK